MILTVLGFVGSGNMATALVRGIGQPVLCSARTPQSAQRLAEISGGEAVASNAELAKRADVVFLVHKPGQLSEVASEVAPHAKAIVSALGGVSLASLRGAYPGIPVIRTMPNTPVELGKGVVVVATEPEADESESETRADVLRLLSGCGTVIELPETQLAAATAAIGVLPAYLAIFAEAVIDSVHRQGLPASVASGIVASTIEGSGALLASLDGDTLAMRRGVTSPGGSTARGLRELERGGLRSAVQAATDAVVGVS